MSLQKDDRVHIKPLGVNGTVVRAAQPPMTGRYLVQSDNGGTAVVWSESELELIVGRAAEHTIQDPESGEITGRMIF